MNTISTTFNNLSKHIINSPKLSKLLPFITYSPQLISHKNFIKISKSTIYSTPTSNKITYTLYKINNPYNQHNHPYFIKITINQLNFYIYFTSFNNTYINHFIDEDLTQLYIHYLNPTFINNNLYKILTLNNFKHNLTLQ